MPLYESVIIARQDISSAQVDSLADALATVIVERGGSVTKREYWGLRNLCYRIKKNRKGHYVLFNVDAPADAVLEMERLMRFNEDVLRYMSVRVDELEEGPSAILSQKGERERPARGPGGPGGRGGRFDRGDRPDRGGFDRGERRDRSE